MLSPLRVAARSTPSLAHLNNKAILSVSGSQASEFLNGILATPIRESPKRPLYSALLHAQGRVLYDVFIYTNTDTATRQQNYLVEYDARSSEAPAMLPMLKKYVLRSKVKIRDATDQYDVWASWGSTVDVPLDNSPKEWHWAASGALKPLWNNAAEEWPWGSGDCSLLDRRTIGMGSRFLVEKGDKPQRSSTHDIKSMNDYLLHRILHGVPEGSTDISPMQAFPMESNLDIMGALDFNKGCYVGQELTVRTYHTGAVRKRILPVVIHEPHKRPEDYVSPDPDAPSHPIGVEIRPAVVPKEGLSAPRPRGAGKLLTSLQGVGLALLRLEHVEAVTKGNLQLQFENTGKTWTVSPWWPSWWPHQASKTS
ncbi:hypothetical protein AMATHDRAFT_74997 [Amanita thiersii Skay4041]|uniref:CAF17 C-terminal domain-containing protein n=1 Tax=Amanita thiersii Skay4041 TaxID=703135 RepID=A0A2A9NKF1_9AGAR|nr:hypothetical protein AMATHDRAFT_74997 [Amanita thiersii Skay4041]